MAKTSPRTEHTASPEPTDIRELLLCMMERLDGMRAELDRLSMKERIDSLAARVADLEAALDT